MCARLAPGAAGRRGRGQRVGDVVRAPQAQLDAGAARRGVQAEVRAKAIGADRRAQLAGAVVSRARALRR